MRRYLAMELSGRAGRFCASLNFNAAMFVPGTPLFIYACAIEWPRLLIACACAARNVARLHNNIIFSFKGPGFNDYT